MFRKVMALVVTMVAMIGCGVPTRTALSPQGQVTNMCLYGGDFLREAYDKGKEDKNKNLVDTYYTWSDWFYGSACDGSLESGSRAEWAQHADSVCTGVKGMLKAFKPYDLDHYSQLKSAYGNNCNQSL
jgi:hypothetical protein